MPSWTRPTPSLTFVPFLMFFSMMTCKDFVRFDGRASGVVLAVLPLPITQGGRGGSGGGQSHRVAGVAAVNFTVHGAAKQTIALTA